MVYVLIDSSCRACCCFYAAAIRGTLCCCTLYCCSQRHFHHSCKRPNHQANRQGSCVVKAFHKGCAALDPMGCAPARLLRQCAHIVMHDSTLQTSCVQGQLVGLALSFLRNFGILSGASGVLRALSSGVPLQPWMIDLLCSELSRSRSVSCFNLTLFQEAVQVCSGIESLSLVFGSSNKRFSGIIPKLVSSTGVL